MYGDELKGLNCGTCKEQKQNNCEMEYDHKPIFGNEPLDFEINTCPLNCILSGHYNFYDDYIYYTETSAVMPPKAECDANFWRLYKMFTQYKNIVLRNK